MIGTSVKSVRASVVAIDNHARALALRLAGQSYETIGPDLGVAPKTARAWVEKALEERRESYTESLDELRALELARLDRVIQKLLERLDRSGNKNPERTSDSIVRAMERRARLLGMDQPDGADGTRRHAQSLTDTDLDLDLLTVTELETFRALVTKALRRPEGAPIAVVEAPAIRSSSSDELSPLPSPPLPDQ